MDQASQSGEEDTGETRSGEPIDRKTEAETASASGDTVRHTGGSSGIKAIHRSTGTGTVASARRTVSNRTPGAVPYNTGPEVQRLSDQYGIDFCNNGQAEKVQRLEKECGAQTVQRWADEGMTVETMGRPRDMEAFRERKASRPTTIPDDIERQNQASLHRNVRRVPDEGPAGNAGAPDTVRNVISRPGTSMDGTVQQEMESKMGGDFSDVQIHTGPEAAAAAESINARAFTVGNHVAFNDGEYDPGSDSGKKLLAHELTHVRQQTAGRVSLLPKGDGDHPGSGHAQASLHVQPKLEVSSPDDPAEKEAEQVADAVVQGGGQAAGTDGSTTADCSTSQRIKTVGRSTSPDQRVTNVGTTNSTVYRALDREFLDSLEWGDEEPDPVLEPGSVDEHSTVNATLSGSWSPDTVLPTMEDPYQQELPNTVVSNVQHHIGLLGHRLTNAFIDDEQEYSENAREYASSTDVEGEEAVLEAQNHAQNDARAEVLPPYTEWVHEYIDITAELFGGFTLSQEVASILLDDEVPHPDDVGAERISVDPTRGRQVRGGAFGRADELRVDDVVQGYMVDVHDHVGTILEDRIETENEAAQNAARAQMGELEGAADRLWQSTHQRVWVDDPDTFIETLASLKPVEGPAVKHIWARRAGIDHDSSRELDQTTEDVRGIPYHSGFFEQAAAAFLRGDMVSGVRHSLKFAANRDDEELTISILRTFRERGAGADRSEEETLEQLERITEAEPGGSGIETHGNSFFQFATYNEEYADTILTESLLDNDVIAALLNPDLNDEEALAQADAIDLKEAFNADLLDFSDPDVDTIFAILEKRSESGEQELLEQAFRTVHDDGMELREKLEEELDATEWDLSKTELILGGPILGPVFSGMRHLLSEDEIEESRPYFNHALALLDGDKAKAQITKLFIAGIEDEPEDVIEAMIELQDMEPVVETPLNENEYQLMADEYISDLEIQTENGRQITDVEGVLEYLTDEETEQVLRAIHQEEQPDSSEAAAEIILWGIEESWFGYGAPQELMLDAFQQIATAENTQEHWDRLLAEAKQRDNSIDTIEDLHERLGVGEGEDGWFTEFSGREQYEAERAYEQIVIAHEDKEGTFDAMYRLAELDYEQVSNGIYSFDPSATPDRIDELWEDTIQELWDDVDDWAKQNEEGHYVEAKDNSRKEEFTQACSQLATYGNMYDARRVALVVSAGNAVAIGIATVGGTVVTIATGGAAGPATKAAVTSLAAGLGNVTVQWAGMGEAFTPDMGVKIMGEATASAMLGVAGAHLSRTEWMQTLKDADNFEQVVLHKMVGNLPSAAEGAGVTDLDAWLDDPAEIGEGLLYAAILEGFAKASSEIAAEKLFESLDIQGQGVEGAMERMESDDVNEDEVADLIEQVPSEPWTDAFANTLENGTQSLMDDAIVTMFEIPLDESEMEVGPQQFAVAVIEAYASAAQSQAVDELTDRIEAEYEQEYERVTDEQVDETNDDLRSATEDSVLRVGESEFTLAELQGFSFEDHDPELETGLDDVSNSGAFANLFGVLPPGGSSGVQSSGDFTVNVQQPWPETKTVIESTDSQLNSEVTVDVDFGIETGQGDSEQLKIDDILEDIETETTQDITDIDIGEFDDTTAYLQYTYEE